MSRIASDYMAQTLAQVGVKRIYGVVGDSLNGFTDALRRVRATLRRTESPHLGRTSSANSASHRAPSHRYTAFGTRPAPARSAH